MAKAKIIIEEGLKSELKQYCFEVCKSLAHKTEDTLEEAHQIGMARFYADYTPKKYKRHYINFYKNVYKRYYKNPHSSVVYGGIEVSNDYLERVYRGTRGGQVIDSTDIVYNLVYLQGKHGMAENWGKTPGPVTVPSPIDNVYMKRDEIIKNIGKFSKDCFIKANEGAYRYITPS